MAKQRWTNSQLFYIHLLEEEGMDFSNIDINISDTDLMWMYHYIQLGQECDSVVRHYSSVSGLAKAYLGALYVGVDPDDDKLLATIRYINIKGLEGENDLDILKQIAGYTYLYGKPPDGQEEEMLNLIWSAFGSDIMLVTEISEQERQFWWEMIPSVKYVSTGTQEGDIIAYLTR